MEDDRCVIEVRVVGIKWQPNNSSYLSNTSSNNSNLSSNLNSSFNSLSNSLTNNNTPNQELVKCSIIASYARTAIVVFQVCYWVLLNGDWQLELGVGMGAC